MEPIPWDQLNFCEVWKNLGARKREKPYSLRYTFSEGTGSTPYGPDYLRPNFLVHGNTLGHVHNKVVEKIQGDLQPIANLFETIYERQQAYNMLVGAGKEILEFATNWRKPKYWKRKGRKIKPATLPEAWLAYNFGVKPLVGSVNSALHLLGSDFPTQVVRAASGTQDLLKIADRQWNRDYFSTPTGQYVKEIRAYIKPNINPNRALMNVVGLSTPFSTAWSVIPWGWAVDYFVNVSDLLSNFENRFPGIQIDEVWATEFLKFKHWTRLTYHTQPQLNKSNWGESVYMSRHSSSLQYQLVYDFPLIGDSRAANLFSAIALSLKGK